MTAAAEERHFEPGCSCGAFGRIARVAALTRLRILAEVSVMVHD
jgi:hypothetical protein